MSSAPKPSSRGVKRVRVKSEDGGNGKDDVQKIVKKRLKAAPTNISVPPPAVVSKPAPNIVRKTSLDSPVPAKFTTTRSTSLGK